MYEQYCSAFSFAIVGWKVWCSDSDFEAGFHAGSTQYCEYHGTVYTHSHGSVAHSAQES